MAHTETRRNRITNDDPNNLCTSNGLKFTVIQDAADALYREYENAAYPHDAESLHAAWRHLQVILNRDRSSER